MKDKKYLTVTDHCLYTGEYKDDAHSIHNLKDRVLKRITIVFHNGSNHDSHFIINVSAEQFKSNLFVWEETLKNILALLFQ